LNNQSILEDEEIVYRRIRVEWARVNDDGRWVLTSQAFNDQGWKPSVDRKILRAAPADSQMEPTDGIAQLLTAEVRATTGLIHNPEKPLADQVTYKLDVIARPIPPNNPEGLAENLSHAQIESDPTVASRSRFDRVKEALSRLAMNRDWVIPPSTPANTH